jgi:hypothetical protein
LRITKVNDDGTVTGKKTTKTGKTGKIEEVTVRIAKDVKVYRGKFDFEAKAYVKDGDELGLTGLKTVFKSVDKVNVTVGGTPLTDKDNLEVAIKDGKTVAKLNGKDIDINTVIWRSKTPLMTRATTDDDGTVTQVLIITPDVVKGKKDAK